MYVRFIAPDIRRLDELQTEAMTIPFFADERPPQGTLGLVDWRHGGWVSRLLLDGRLTGESGETVLIPSRPKLSCEKLFLFGLGGRADFGPEVFEFTMRRVLETLTRARVRASTCVLPGRHLQMMEPEAAIELLLHVARDYPEQDEVTLVETLEAQKAMSPVLQRDRRRTRAVEI